MRMRNELKTCDFTGKVAANLFKMLNEGKVSLVVEGGWQTVIVTDELPSDLIYPEGWYFSEGYFRNKHNSTTGQYAEIEMRRSNGRTW